MPIISRTHASTWGLLLLAGLLLTGCERPGAAPVPGVAAEATYYDVRGQLDSLTRLLTARRADVRKRVSIRGSAPETTRVAGVKWADELQIFHQADLNKAALRGAYDVETSHDGSGAGATTRYVYTRRPGHPNAPVARLDVRCYPGRRLRYLTVIIDQHNVLFDSTKELTISCDNAPPGGISYGVRGSQKLVFFETLRFSTSAEVL